MVQGSVERDVTEGQYVLNLVCVWMDQSFFA